MGKAAPCCCLLLLVAGCHSPETTSAVTRPLCPSWYTETALLKVKSISRQALGSCCRSCMQTGSSRDDWICLLVADDALVRRNSWTAFASGACGTNQGRCRWIRNEVCIQIKAAVDVQTVCRWEHPGCYSMSYV